MASIIDAETVQWAIKCCTPDFSVLSDESSCIYALNFIGVLALCPINPPPKLHPVNHSLPTRPYG